ncbi:hypothetical protein LCL97_10485 [Seohaeicola saemankumensis]|nr:hypothetical protein [Seohaeicola saemankumensis]
MSRTSNVAGSAPCAGCKVQETSAAAPVASPMAARIDQRFMWLSSARVYRPVPTCPSGRVPRIALFASRFRSLTPKRNRASPAQVTSRFGTLSPRPKALAAPSWPHLPACPLGLLPTIVDR